MTKPISLPSPAGGTFMEQLKLKCLIFTISLKIDTFNIIYKMSSIPNAGFLIHAILAETFYI